MEASVMSLLHTQRFTAAEASAKLGVTQSTLANWRSQGKGPIAVRIGRAPYYFAEDLEAYLRDQREKAHADQKTRTMVALPIYDRRPRVHRFNGATGHRGQPESR